MMQSADQLLTIKDINNVFYKSLRIDLEGSNVDLVLVCFLRSAIFPTAIVFAFCQINDLMLKKNTITRF